MLLLNNNRSYHRSYLINRFNHCLNMTDPLPLLIVKDIALTFKQRKVIDGLSFSIEPGEIVCLLGASGCGKTTVLRSIAGFEPLSHGSIVLNQQLLSSNTVHIPTQKRGIGMVFQDYALFPHLNVADNIAFGLHSNKQPASEKSKRIAMMLDLIGLSNLDKRYIHELSGGQQQRIALARALAPQPQLLLLDEPFSNLDIELRERLGQEVRAILKKTGTTAILVTHDQYEAFAVADKIGIVYDGKICQWGTPYDLYHEPINRYVANFIGEGVLLPATIVSNQSIECELGHIRHTVNHNLSGTHVDLLIRPDDVQYDQYSTLQAKIIAKFFRGAYFLYTLQLPSSNTVLSLVPSDHNHIIGEYIGIKLSIKHIITFNK